MITFDEVGLLLDDIALDLPKDIYKELNGGINLLPGVKMHPENKCNDLFILGEYRHDWALGRFINIYYGSFIRLYGHMSYEQQRKKLKNVLIHEFTHHLESMAGERDLEIEDAINIAKYKQKL